MTHLETYFRKPNSDCYASDFGWHDSKTHELLVSYQKLKTKMEQYKLTEQPTEESDKESVQPETVEPAKKKLKKVKVD